MIETLFNDLFNQEIKLILNTLAANDKNSINGGNEWNNFTFEISKLLFFLTYKSCFDPNFDAQKLDSSSLKDFNIKQCYEDVKALIGRFFKPFLYHKI